MVLVCATQGGYDRLFSTTLRHWESDEAMHQKPVATDLEQVVAEAAFLDPVNGAKSSRPMPSSVSSSDAGPAITTQVTACPALIVP